jgi:iron complex outermembrane recepter protein
MRHIHISALACAIFWASAANAQQVSEEPQESEIIVTGEKSNRTLQDTPTSVAVTTPERIRRENILTIQDIYNRTANVGETYGTAGFTIRGISNQGVGGGGNADTATVYVDGAPIPREALFGGPTDLWDIQQVEILRGPQSTIQGLNALAGAIVLTTREASTTEYSADARVLWSEHNDRTFSAAVGGPLVKDELGIRLSVERRNDRGIIRNVTRGGYDDALESLNLRGKLKWTPSALPGLEVQASYNRVRRDGGYLYEYARTDVPDFFDNRISTGNAPSRGHIKTDIAVLNMGYEITPRLRFSSITSFNKTHTRALIDTDGTAADLQVVDNTNDFRTWTQEMRLNYNGDRLSGVLGAWAYRRSGGLVAANRLNINTPTGTIAALLQGGGFPAATATQIADLYTNALPVIPVAYAADAPQLVRTAALFGDVRYKLTDRLSLIGGFRYDHEANRYTAETVATFTGTLPSPATFGAAGTPLYLAITAVNQGVLGLVQGANSARATNARSFDAFLPKAGVSMEWTPDLTTSFTVQRAYRSGGSSQNPARALLFGLNEYDYNTVNAGKSHLYGFEIEAQGRISRTVDAYASVGHVRTKFDKFTLPTGTTSTLELAGSEFPYAARWTIAGGVNARVGPVVGNLNANYRGPVFTDVGTTQAQGRLPGRTVVNARLGWEMERFTVFAFARNLLNEKYRQYDFASSGRAILGEPQTFGGGIEVHF